MNKTLHSGYVAAMRTTIVAAPAQARAEAGAPGFRSRGRAPDVRRRSGPPAPFIYGPGSRVLRHAFDYDGSPRLCLLLGGPYY